MTKICSHCKVLKSIDCFGKNKGYKDGIHGWCKECARKNRKESYKRNIESEKQKALALHHKRQQNEPEYRERRKAYQKEYNQDYMKRPETRKKMRRWHQNYMSNHRNRISRRISFQIWFSLRDKLDKTNRKNRRHWEDLVDFSLDQLVAHLESQFHGGMTWDNYGGDMGWQIDHKTPRTWFEFESEKDEGFKQCWKLKNLQPMWLSDNASKGNRRAG